MRDYYEVCCFNSRLREEATTQAFQASQRCSGFNSRLREEATAPDSAARLLLDGFNSRLREEATTMLMNSTEYASVSTHASVRRRLLR